MHHIMDMVDIAATAALLDIIVLVMIIIMLAQLVHTPLVINRVATLVHLVQHQVLLLLLVILRLVVEDII